ncbi:MAG: right-handed parallel beta-helix repeat-containing protein [Thermoplasmata archaeon]|nr:MAG: right-handed parallel beta-helix repeat-containing protein [Thermoplasmata archaeon]
MKIRSIIISIILIFTIFTTVDLVFEFSPSYGSATIYVPNDYPTIQDAINASKDGDTVYVFSGTYYENVVVNKTIDLIGEDKETTIIDGEWSGVVINVSANWVNITGFTITRSEGEYKCAGIKLYNVHNCRLVNNNVTSNGARGIYLYYSSFINIISNTITSNYGDGIYLYFSDENNIIGNNVSDNRFSSGIILHNSSNNAIENNIVSNNEGFGIYLYQSSLNNIINNTCNSNSYHGISLGGSSSNMIANNTCSNNSEIGIDINNFSPDNNIIDNTVTSNLRDGIFIYYSSNGTNIIHNNVLNNDWSGISIYHSSNNIITDNTVYFNNFYGIVLSTYPGPFPYETANNEVTNNNVMDNGDTGIYLYISRNNNITGNNISNNKNGTHLYALSDNNIITDNIISSNKYDGIHIEFASKYNIITNNRISSNNNGISIEMISTDNNILNNDISDNLEGINVTTSSYNNMSGNNISNNEHGIRFFKANDNRIITNNVSLNSLDGIRLLSSSKRNSIIDNTVFSNSNYGIYINDSLNNNIYHNNIITNTIQAYDGTNNGNQWDDGYPSGGNYWSDWTTPDDYHGPDQDILGSDGIVDNGTVGGGGKNPYVIDSDSQDNYPLTTPHPMLLTLYIKASADGRDAILYWDQPSIFGVSHYLIYRSEDQTNFDFNNVWVNTKTDTQPGESLSNPLRTTWIDFNASVPGNKNYREQYYYVIQSVYESGKMSPSSRTVGKWTKSFSQGISTFSLPLEPIDPIYVDYCTHSMNATYIRYIDPNQHIWRQHNFGDGTKNNTQMKLGEGYEIKLSNQTVFTFTGLPGAMISYYGNSGFLGFDPTTEADCLEVTIQENGDVNVTWEDPGSMGPGDYYYEIYYSYKRDGFFGYLDFDYSQVCSPVGFGTNNVTHVGAQANDPGKRLYYMVVPFNALGIRGTSTYSIGIWTEEYLSQYDTMGIPLKLDVDHTADWYCDNIPDTVGINYFDYDGQRWCWHSKRMSEGAYDTVLKMTEGYQISTSDTTEFTFIGV